MKNVVLSSSAKVKINAPINRVWQLQSDINRWPRWQNDVATAKLDGKLTKGSVFRWKAMGMSIVSRLQRVDKPNRLEWSGDSLGMHAEHKWKFVQDGRETWVETWEELSGWFPRILKLFDKDFLTKSLNKALIKLKLEAEKGE